MNNKYRTLKYKPLVRIRIDVYQDLTTKSFLKKKWRLLTLLLTKKKKKKRKYCLINSNLKSLTKFPVYRRYQYQKFLFFRKSIRIIYGGFKDYRFKNIALSTKHTQWRGYAQKLEIKSFVFLSRLKLCFSISEGKIHYRHGRIYVNGINTKNYINKGDILHFSPLFEKLLKRRLAFIFKRKTYVSKKNKFQRNLVRLDKNIDFDVNSLRFYFLNKIKYFRNHPFLIRFEKINRWYNRN